MLITIGSVTTAARASKIIEQIANVSVRVVHTPHELNRGGCSYSLQFNDKYENAVRKVITDYKIPVKKWYSQTSIGNKRVYNALP